MMAGLTRRHALAGLAALPCGGFGISAAAMSVLTGDTLLIGSDQIERRISVRHGAPAVTRTIRKPGQHSSGGWTFDGGAELGVVLADGMCPTWTVADVRADRYGAAQLLLRSSIDRLTAIVSYSADAGDDCLTKQVALCLADGAPLLIASVICERLRIRDEHLNDCTVVDDRHRHCSHVPFVQPLLNPVQIAGAEGGALVVGPMAGARAALERAQGCVEVIVDYRPARWLRAGETMALQTSLLSLR